MEPRNADRVVAILAARIQKLELEKAYLMDDVMTLEDKLKEVEANGSKPVEPGGN